MANTIAKPCNELRTSFFRDCYCLNCGVLSQLHTAEGWRSYYERAASVCEVFAGKSRARCTELEEGAAQYREWAEAFPWGAR